MRRLNYVIPEIEILGIAAEKGFATSTEDLEDGGIW